MFSKGVSPVTKNSLAVLAKYNLINQFYLAGGTACALRLGHRLSFDLDFFTPKNFSQKDLVAWMRKMGEFELDQIKKNTLLGVFINTKVSFFKYPYVLIDKLDLFEKIKIAGVNDLMAMKIDAISTRGKKRDFIDLYFLSKKNSLSKAIEYYKKKYARLNLNLHHSFRSLVYFTDADKDEMPKMLKKCSWLEVKKYFLKTVPQVFNEELKRIK